MSKSALPAVIIVGVGGYFIYKANPQSSLSIGIRKVGTSLQSLLAGVQKAPVVANGNRGPANPYPYITQDGTVVQSSAPDAPGSLLSFVAPWSESQPPNLINTYRTAATVAAGDPLGGDPSL